MARKRKVAPTFQCAQCKRVVERRYNKRFQYYDNFTKYCSRECQWESQRTGSIHRTGYRIFTIRGRQVPEHRLVMESVVGRKLFPYETVHHKNGVRSDNRPENLELWSTRNPKGQRIEDKISWAQEFLPQYGFTVSKPPSDSTWVNGLLSL